MHRKLTTEQQALNYKPERYDRLWETSVGGNIIACDMIGWGKHHRFIHHIPINHQCVDPCIVIRAEIVTCFEFK